MTTSKKISAAAVGGAVGVVTVWAFNAVTGIVVPAEVAAAWGTLMTFIASVAIPDAIEE